VAKGRDTEYVQIENSKSDTIVFFLEKKEKYRSVHDTCSRQLEISRDFVNLENMSTQSIKDIYRNICVYL